MMTSFDVIIFFRVRVEMIRTCKCVSVGRQSCELSGSERSEPSEREGEGRQMRPARADAKSSQECLSEKYHLVWYFVAGTITFPFGKVMVLFW